MGERLPPAAGSAKSGDSMSAFRRQSLEEMPANEAVNARYQNAHGRPPRTSDSAGLRVGSRNGLESFEIGLHHHLDKLFEADLGYPAEVGFRFGGIAD